MRKAEEWSEREDTQDVVAWGSPGRVLEREAHKQLSEIAKRYNKIKGENKWGHFLMGQNFKMQSKPIYKLPLILVQTLN